MELSRHLNFFAVLIAVVENLLIVFFDVQIGTVLEAVDLKLEVCGVHLPPLIKHITATQPKAQTNITAPRITRGVLIAVNNSVGSNINLISAPVLLVYVYIIA
jgi:hypothetical protein